MPLTFKCLCLVVRFFIKRTVIAFDRRLGCDSFNNRHFYLHSMEPLNRTEHGVPLHPCLRWKPRSASEYPAVQACRGKTHLGTPTSSCATLLHELPSEGVGIELCASRYPRPSSKIPCNRPPPQLNISGGMERKRQRCSMKHMVEFKSRTAQTEA